MEALMKRLQAKNASLVWFVNFNSTHIHTAHMRWIRFNNKKKIMFGNVERVWNRKKAKCAWWWLERITCYTRGPNSMIESHKLKTFQQSRHDIPTMRTDEAYSRTRRIDKTNERTKKKTHAENQFSNDNWINTLNNSLACWESNKIVEFYFVTKR